MQARPHAFPGGLRLEAADVLILATIAAFAALAILFRFPGWPLAVVSDLVAATVLLAALAAARRVPQGLGHALLRIGTVSLACAYLFGAVDHLQLLVHTHWQDARILALESWALGTQPTIWLERFVHPWLTEWMMFAYVIYIALYPLVCSAIYLHRGEAALEECLLALAAVNVACDLGFIAFPVAGPTAFMGSSFTVPLDGYLFTALGELIRGRLHYPGGSLPSPHAAAATVLWAMTWKYRRGLFWLLTPVVLTLYAATFYCRYHYLTDTVAGIATAIAALLATPPLLRWWGTRSATR